MIRRRVDFPDPEGPTMHTKSRSSSSNPTFARTLNSFPASKYDFETPWISRNAGGRAGGSVPFSIVVPAILHLQPVPRDRAPEQGSPQELVHREDDEDHREDREQEDLAVGGDRPCGIAERGDVHHRPDPGYLVETPAALDVLGHDQGVPSRPPCGDAPGEDRGHDGGQDQPLPVREPPQSEGARGLLEVA